MGVCPIHSAQGEHVLDGVLSPPHIIRNLCKLVFDFIQ